MKHLHRFVRRAAAFVLAAALCVCVLAPAASAATTMGGADTTLIPAEEENCLAWLFGTSDTITMPYLNIKGKGLQRNVTLNLVDCLVGITYTELGSIGSYVSASAVPETHNSPAWPGSVTRRSFSSKRNTFSLGKACPMGSTSSGAKTRSGRM